MSAMMLIASVAFSQATTYPWTEDFESGSLETNGWTTEIVSGSENWHVGISAHSPAHSGNSSVVISNESYGGDTAKLFSPMFTRPEDRDTFRLSFWYINPSWGGDVDIMELYILNGESSVKIYEVIDSHEEWTYAEVDFLVAALPQTFQFCFVGIPKYGYDLQIDDFTLGGDAYDPSEDDNQEDEVTTYPWFDDFESGYFQTKGWTTQIVSGSVTWRMERESYSGAYSGQYSAVASNSSYDGDVTELISTTFVRPTDIDTIKLSFAYVNPAWGSDINDMYVYYADAENLNIRTEVYGTNGTPNDSWVNTYAIIPVENLPEKFKVVFKANLAYGYDLQLDDVAVSEYVYIPPTVDTIETEEYLQVGTERLLTGMPTDVDYGYSYCQEIFLAREMGGARTIYSLGFNSDESIEDFRRHVSISLGYTEKNWYDSINDWVPVADLHEVYNGNFDLYENGGWVYAVLDEPFEYNGTDNLVVAFSDTTGGRNYFTVNFLTSTSFYNGMTRCASFVNDSQYDLNDLGQINGGNNNRRNNIRFGLVPMEVPAQVYDTVETAGYLQVGTGFTVQLNMPFNTYYNYSYSQQIFDAGELGRPRDIYSVSINYVGGEYGITPQSTTRNIDVYLGYTDKDGYNGSDWAETDGFTKVFSDMIEVPENPGWVTFVFDSAFRYVDTANLVVAFIDKTDEFDASRLFACTKSSFVNKVLSAVNDDYEYVINDLTYNSDASSYRSNIRFGIIPVEMHTITVMANDSTMGVVTGGGRCMPYDGRTISATAYPGFQFNGWSDGAIENPRFLVPTTDTTVIANFSALHNDTIYYDNDTYGNVIGFHGDHVEWGIRISPARIAARTQLTEVLFYVDGEYAFGQYDLNVYQGVDTIPTVSILHDTIVVDSAAQGWMSFGFEPVAIDTTKPMWVILSNEGTRYPAVVSSFVDEGYKDGAWWNSNGTWQQQSYGAWMIRAVMPFADDAVEEMTMETISVYPNPAGDFIYIDGVESGSTVEIYNTLGSIVRNFTYEGGEVDFSGMPAGMYILRANGNVVRFVKE